MNLQDIRNLIWHNDVNGAMQALFNRVQEGEGHNQRLRDDLIILNRRFEDFKHKESLGALSADEVRKENTLLTSALLNLIDEMETGKAAQAPLDSPPDNRPAAPEKGKQPWLYILIGIGALLVLFMLFRTPQPPPSPDGGNGYIPPESPPTIVEKVIDINGIWLTNHPPLVYQIDQNGHSYIWRVVGAPDSGTGRIEGENVISQIGGRDVVYFISAKFPDGRPSELRTHDAQFAGIVLMREQ